MRSTCSWRRSKLLTVDPQIPGQPPVEHVTPGPGLPAAGRFHIVPRTAAINEESSSPGLRSDAWRMSVQWGATDIAAVAASKPYDRPS